MDDTKTEVLVVGGGPGGLTAALLLARYGVAVTLVERHAGTAIHPRARGLNVRTMEILRSLGLEHPVREAGAALAASKYMLFVETLAGREIRRVPDDDLVATADVLAAITPCGWCQCAQDVLEPLLAAAGRTHGANLCFGTELLSFHEEGDSVLTVVAERATGQQRRIAARYVIAADGADSPVRTAPGIARRGRGPLEHFVNIYFRADLRDLVRDRWFGICFVENATMEGIMLAVDNAERWLLNVSYDPSKVKPPQTLHRSVALSWLSLPWVCLILRSTS